MAALQDFFHRPVGIFHWILDREDPENCARLAADFGFSCVQWNLPEDDSKSDEEHAAAALEAFARRDIRVVALSGYQNPIDPHPEAKAAGVRLLERHIDIAPMFPDCTGVATETGTKNAECPWFSHPDNLKSESWEEMLSVLRPLIQRARLRGTRLLIEGYVENVVRTVGDLTRLKNELGEDRPDFVMDPFNLVLEQDLPRLPEVIHEVFDTIGKDCGVAHAKDLAYENGVVSTPRSGTGVFDFPTYFRLLDERLPDVPLILEHLEFQEIGEVLDFLKNQYQPQRPL